MWKIFPVLALGLSSCSSEPASTPEPAAPSSDPCATDVANPTTVSLAALLANPERFEGQSVGVIGFFHQGFEHSAIYLHREDFVQSIKPNALWVTGSSVPDGLSGRYARLEGIFTATQGGHLGQWSGTLCNVGRATPWGRDES